MKDYLKNIPITALGLLFAFLVGFSEQEKLGILVSKSSVLSFPEDIVDVELGNSDYSFKVKGKNLLLFAKKKNAEPTTLFIRYGKNKQAYVAEIFPDDASVLQRSLPYAPAHPIQNPENSMQQAPIEPKRPTVFSPNQKQEYFIFGCNKDGVKVILTNIIHQGEITHLRFFIENNTTTNLKIGHYTFEYITYLKKFIFLTSKKIKQVEPNSAPTVILLEAGGGDYFDFAVPTFISNGGLEVFLGESAQGEREYKIFIPSKVLLKARRK
ncbi:MAG: hypothetical protein ACYC2U_06380 [Candidatus Amoebophilus sp.]